MMVKLRAITRVFIMKWSEVLQYRGDLVLWTFAIAITPLVSLAVWYAVATSTQSAQDPRDILTYYILVMLLGIATASWQGFELIQEILSGAIVRYLIRPLSMFWIRIAGTIVTKILQLSVPVLTFCGVLLIFPHWFSSALFKVEHLLLFIPSLLLAITISFIMDMTIGTMAFWLEDAQELQSYRFLLMQVASGILVPFAVMPPAARDVLGSLPFRYIISAPAEIILGQAEGTAALALLAYQALWVVVLALLLAFVWKRGLKIYAAPGQ